MVGCDLTGANLAEAFLGGANLCNLTGSPSGDVCEESGSITDDNGDGYDDESYDAGFDIGALSGDSNGDGVLNVLDLVYFVEIIVNGE